MSKTTKWGAADWLCAALAALLGGGVYAFRWFAVVPRATVGICAAANAPGFCTPRHWMLLGQYYGAWGWAGLALGLAAFFGGSRVLGALALGMGIASVVNYDATAGIIGATFGLAAWFSLTSNRPGWSV
ncbi:MAG: hypothetical protein P4L52_06010 [Acidocella sp.]|nr:hypothetical protein [Acidocella sp.]